MTNHRLIYKRYVSVIFLSDFYDELLHGLIKNKIAKTYLTHLLNSISISLVTDAPRRFEGDLEMPRM
jgi:hypothetical protein